MKKYELRTGMQIETERGEKRYVLLGTENGDITTSNSTTTVHGFERLYNTWELNNWNDDLTHITKAHMIGDIIKVYGFWGNLIWERKEIPKYTKEELFKIVGHKFELKN